MLILLNKKRRTWLGLWLRIYYLNIKLFFLSDQFLRLLPQRLTIYRTLIEILNS